MDFYATGITKLLLIAKNMLTVIVLILTNKDVFDPSYNDLKFMNPNHNYFCTNLIDFAFCKTFEISFKSEWQPCWVEYSWL